MPHLNRFWPFLPLTDSKKGKIKNMIANTNTHKIHFDDCSAIGMIKPDHKLHVTGAECDNYSPCGWCHGPRDRILNTLLETTPTNIVSCPDPLVRCLLKENGCDACGSNFGDVKMYSHPGGATLPSIPGHWWIYFKCFECNSKSSFKLLPELLVLALMKEGRSEG